VACDRTHPRDRRDAGGAGGDEPSQRAPGASAVHVDPGELRSGISPNRLIEALFCLQDQLFDLKVGPLRRWLREEEEPQEAREELEEAPSLPPAA
jgi:hypothetical protein